MAQQNLAIGHALASFRRQPPALAQQHQQVAGIARNQLIVQLQLVGQQLIAIGIDDADMALGEDLAARMVPRHLVGAHRLVGAAQKDIAAGDNGVAVGQIFGLVGLKGDGRVLGCGDGRGD